MSKAAINLTALAESLGTPAPVKPQEPRPKKLDNVITLRCGRCNSNYEKRWYADIQLWYGECQFHGQCSPAPCRLQADADVERAIQTQLSDLSSEISALTTGQLTQYETAIQQATQEALDAYVSEHRQEYEDLTRNRIKEQLYRLNIEVRREQLRAEVYARLAKAE